MFEIISYFIKIRT